MGSGKKLVPHGWVYSLVHTAAPFSLALGRSWSGGPLRGGRAFVAQKPEQCAVLLPCRPGWRGLGLPQDVKQPGEGPKHP